MEQAKHKQPQEKVCNSTSGRYFKHTEICKITQKTGHINNE